MSRIYLLTVCLFVVAACQPGGSGYSYGASDASDDQGYYQVSITPSL